LIIFGYIVFIIVNKNEGILNDVGLNKILLFSIGIILICISNIFAYYSSFNECYLNFILKHIGVITVLTIFYLCISMGYELGISNFDCNIIEEKLKLTKMFSQNPSPSVNTLSKYKLLANSNSRYRIEKSSNYNINGSAININAINACSTSSYNNLNTNNNERSFSLKTENTSNIDKNHDIVGSSCAFNSDFNSNNDETIGSLVSTNFIEVTKMNEKTNNINISNNSINISSMNNNVITSNEKIDNSNDVEKSSIPPNCTEISQKKENTEKFNDTNSVINNDNNLISSIDDKNSINESYTSLNHMEINQMQCSNAELLQSENCELNQKIEQPKKVIKKNIKNVHSLFIVVSLLYPLIVIVTIITPLIMNYFEKEEDKLYTIQSDNGEWHFKCKLDNTNLIYNLLEELFIVFILVKGKSIFKYNYIFKNTRYITYSNIVQVIFGPLINVILNIILLI